MTNLKSSLDDLCYSGRDHVKKLIDWLLIEVLSAGGDGDATWVVKNLDIFKLRAFVQDECLSSKDLRYWSISDVEKTPEGGHVFSLSNHQEALVITTDPSHVPSWSQCTITL